MAKTPEINEALAPIFSVDATLLQREQGGFSRYKVCIVHIPSGIAYRTEYAHGSACEYDSNDVVFCILTDAGSYDMLVGSTDDDRMAEFLTEYGYCAGTSEDVRQGMEAYRGCQRASRFLVGTVGEEGIQHLLDLFQDY